MDSPRFPSPDLAVQRKWVWGLNLTDGVEPPNPSRDHRMCTRHLHSSFYINHFQGVQLVYPIAARNRTSAVGQGDSPDPHLHLSPSFLPPLVRLGSGVVSCFALPRDKCPNPWTCPLGLPLLPLFIRACTPHSRDGISCGTIPTQGRFSISCGPRKGLLSPLGNWPGKS